MVARRSSFLGRSAAVLVLIASAAAAGPVQRRGWPLVHVPDPVAADATRRALDRAWVLLGLPSCNAVLDDFSDRWGCPLADRLAALEVDARTYLTMLVFVDDSRHTRCAGGTLAFTVPGSRVVRLCSGQVKREWQGRPEHTVAALIHEVLHTLGLGENPPSSKEITRRVHARCLQN